LLNSQTGLPFAGNIIPKNRIVNPIALALISNPSLYPVPTQKGTGTLGVVNDYEGQSATFTNSCQGDAKLDYTATARDTISGRFTVSRVDLGNTRVPLPVIMATASSYQTTGGTVGWTHIFSTNTINEARFAFTRVRQQDNPQDVFGDLGKSGNQKFGIPGTQVTAGLSQIGPGGTEGLTAIGSAGVADDFITNDFQYTDMLIWQFGHHLLKIGGEALRYQQNYFYSGNSGLLGFFTFNGSYSHSSFADFLLGDVGEVGIGSKTGHFGQLQWRDAFFLQDDFKISPNLNFCLKPASSTT
jgi:hypothetical protein